MNKSLRTIREDLGWSQADLAHRIGVSLSTLSRWERGRTKEPLISAVVRKTNRRLHYLLAMSGDSLIKQVEESPTYTSLHHGDDMMLVACSKKYMQDYPGLSMLIGFPIANILLGKAKRHYNENLELMQKALCSPGSTAAWVTEDISTAGFMLRGKTMHIMVVGPKLVLSEGRDTMPEDLPPRLEIALVET